MMVKYDQSYILHTLPKIFILQFSETILEVLKLDGKIVFTARVS